MADGRKQMAGAGGRWQRQMAGAGGRLQEQVAGADGRSRCTRQIAGAGVF